jgi:sec-independent protein translocase protein TatA
MAIFGLPGGAEWWIILLVIVLLFGPTQIPKLAKMLGKSAKSLKDGIDGKIGEEEEEPKAATSDKAAKSDKAAAKKDDAGEA